MMKEAMDLLTSIKVAISVEHYARIRTIDHHDFSSVKREVIQIQGKAEHEYLDIGVQYLKRFYVMLVLDPLNPPVVSKPVDVFWHAHILHTHMYMVFCNEVFGEYIHHNPLLIDDPIAMAFITEYYKATVKKNRDVFRDVDEDFMPPDYSFATEGNTQPPTTITNAILLAHALYPADKPFRIVPFEKLA
jgi:hypothetical protein